MSAYRSVRLAQALVVLPMLAAGLFSARPAFGYDPNSSALRAWPYEGRPGDTLYLSGSGLKPRTPLYIMVACPNWFSPHVSEWGNLQIIAPPKGPKTDANGQFTHWPFHVPRLNHVSSSGCEIYAEDGTPGQAYGPAIPGTYYILGPRDAIKPCDTHICFTVNPKPSRVKSGLYESVDIEGWGGARADVTVTFPGNGTVVKTVTLDWNGSRHVSFQVPKGMADTTRVRVSVHCRLGRYSGDSKAEFTVVH